MIAMLVIVPMAMAVTMIVPMPVTVVVAVVVAMTMAMGIMAVTMTMLVPLAVSVAVTMIIMAVTMIAMTAVMIVAAAICTRFGLERRFDIDHRQAQAQQQVPQHGIMVQLQVVLADFDRYMAVAQVIGGAQQNLRIHARRTPHRLRGSGDAHEISVLGNQRIAIAQYRAFRQEQGDFLASVQHGGQLAAAAGFEGQLQRWRPTQERLCDGMARTDYFLDTFHADFERWACERMGLARSRRDGVPKKS
jgi:hypothetical protein